jgi:hypothetical protein
VSVVGLLLLHFFKSIRRPCRFGLRGVHCCAYGLVYVCVFVCGRPSTLPRAVWAMCPPWVRLLTPLPSVPTPCRPSRPWRSEASPPFLPNAPLEMYVWFGVPLRSQLAVRVGRSQGGSLHNSPCIWDRHRTHKASYTRRKTISTQNTNIRPHTMTAILGTGTWTALSQSRRHQCGRWLSSPHPAAHHLQARTTTPQST